MSPKVPSKVALAKRATPRASPLVRAKKWLGSWLTDVEYRLRISKPFTHERGGTRVFYPGCSLTAADPELVMRAYEWLRARDPSVELWSDCCGMPLEKFSSPEAAERGRERTRKQLRDSSTTEIITACGNCTVQFQKLGVPGLQLTSLYGLLAEEDWGPRATHEPTVVHHPCSARIDKGQQQHFRKLADRLHLNVVNADETKHPLACCLIKSPAAMAKREALADSKLVTYCAHCTMSFQQDVPTRHVLQEIFGKPEDVWAPKGKVARFRQYQRFARLAAARASAPSPTASTGAARSWWPRALFAVLAIVVLVLASRHVDLSQKTLALVSWSRDAGPLGALVYGLAYVLATVLFLPGSVLTLGAGFAWGTTLGVAIVSPVSVLAATAAFLLGRTLLRAKVERRLGAHPRFAAIDRAVGENGLKLVLLLRLSPVLPFNALNYALALTRVRLRDYVIGSAIGMFPATVLYVYLGTLVTSGSELLAGHRPPVGAAGNALYWGGLLATLLVVVLTTRMARTELNKVLAEPTS
jgi:uncharacterized membrane protein YdjX (TVP38/TMEM64 family)